MCDYANEIGVERFIELYRVDIAYNGFIEMRLNALSSFLSSFSSNEKFSKEQRIAYIHTFLLFVIIGAISRRFY